MEHIRELKNIIFETLGLTTAERDAACKTVIGLFKNVSNATRQSRRNL